MIGRGIVAYCDSRRTQTVRSNDESNAYICRAGIMREIALDDADRRSSLYFPVSESRQASESSVTNGKVW